MRSFLLVVACALGLASSAQAQELYSLSDFLGTWYGENETVPDGQRRVVPVQIDVSEIPVLRGPRRFNVRLVIRCMDRPNETCDLGAAQVEAIDGNGFQLPVRLASRHTSALDFCGFTFILTSGTFDDGVTYTRFRKHGLMYSVSPGRGICRPGEFSGITRSSGFVNRTPPRRLELRPDVLPRPIPPVLPPPRF